MMPGPSYCWWMRLRLMLLVVTMIMSTPALHVQAVLSEPAHQAAHAHAQQPANAPLPQACASDLDCSLNGVCNPVSKRCDCDVEWSGMSLNGSCSAMAFQGAAFPLGYGMHPRLNATWGGGAIMDPATGKFHLYVSDMAGGGYLRGWRTESQVVHAVADTPVGPYTRVGIAITKWAHNPAPITVPQSMGGGFAIFHIGGGGGPPPQPAPLGLGPFAPVPTAPASATAMATRNASFAVATAGHGGHGSYRGASIHVAPALGGPWTPLQNSRLPSCNNPGPAVHPNGTVYCVCGGALLRLVGPALSGGAWVNAGSVPALGEDQDLSFDHRGNWHILYHSFDRRSTIVKGNTVGCASNNTVSAHVFSADGQHWRVGLEQPYTPHIAMAAGGTTTVSTRERPKVLRDSTGRATHLFNGVSSAANCTKAQCAPHSVACDNCKYGTWTYTLVLAFKKTPATPTLSSASTQVPP